VTKVYRDFSLKSAEEKRFNDGRLPSANVPKTLVLRNDVRFIFFVF